MCTGFFYANTILLHLHTQLSTLLHSSPMLISHQNSALSVLRYTKQWRWLGLLLILITYIAMGLLQRDPWKNDDVLYHALTQQWIQYYSTPTHTNLSPPLISMALPTLAQQPFVRDGLLHYYSLSVTSFITAQLNIVLNIAQVSDLQLTQYAARLNQFISWGFLCAALWWTVAQYRPFIPLGARDRLGNMRQINPIATLPYTASLTLFKTPELFGLSLLWLLSCLGLCARTHEITPELLQIGLLTGYLGCLPLSLRRQNRAAWLGGGWLGLLILNKGVMSLWLVACYWMALMTFVPSWRLVAWRQISHHIFGASILILGVALGLIGHAYLFNLSALLWLPVWADAWWHYQTTLLTLDSVRIVTVMKQYSYHMLWFALPISGIAAWGSWRYRDIRHTLGWQLLSSTIIGTLLHLLILNTYQEARLLALLPPLVIMTAFITPMLGQHSQRFMSWFAVNYGSLFLVSLLSLALIVEYGIGTPIYMNFYKLAPGYHYHLTLWQWGIIATTTLTWLFICWRFIQSPLPPLGEINRRFYNFPPILCATGLMLNWIILIALFLPWGNHIKSYREVTEALSQQLSPHQTLCTLNVGLPQYASIQLFTTLQLQPLYFHTNATHITPKCNALLIQGVATDTADSYLHDYSYFKSTHALRWVGRRPADQQERFWLLTQQR
jgi:hypothetical protein